MRRTHAPAPVVPEYTPPCAHEVDRDRQDVLDRLLSESADRLAYAPVPHADAEECWVAHRGVLIGTLENREPAVALGEWWATPADGGEPIGPLRYARAAAARLLEPR